MEKPRKYFRIGQQVFAKTKGLPPWPAKVIRVDKAHKKKYKVRLYGSYITTEVKEHEMYPFKAYKSKLVNVKSAKVSGFLKALKEAEGNKSAKPAQNTLKIREEKFVEESKDDLVKLQQATETQTPRIKTEPVSAIVDPDSPSIDAQSALETESQLVPESSSRASVPETSCEPVLCTSSSKLQNNTVEELVNSADVPDVCEEITLAANNAPNREETTSLNIAAIITSISEAENTTKLQYLSSFEVPLAIKVEGDGETEKNCYDDEPEVLTEVSKTSEARVHIAMIEIDEEEPKVFEVQSTKSMEKPRNVETVIALEEPEFVEIADDEQNLPEEIEDVPVFRPKVENEVKKNGGNNGIISIVLSSSSEGESETEENSVANEGNKSVSKPNETADTRKESSPAGRKRNLKDSGENESSPKRPCIIGKGANDPTVSDEEASTGSQNDIGTRVIRSPDHVVRDGETCLSTNSTALSWPVNASTDGNSSTNPAEAPEPCRKIVQQPSSGEPDADKGPNLGEKAPDKLRQKNFLREEAKMVRLESDIRRALSIKDPNLTKALAHLNDLSMLKIEALMLKKHPIVIDTIRKLKRYIGPADCPGITKEKREFYVEELHKIRKKADEILEEQIKPLFDAPAVDISFWDMFYDTLERFRSTTSSLTDSQVIMLTSE